ncbi:hypothetical protein [Saccharopolyspora endophytica]|uniref:hypothetical protein n=1 Tax=Saccharopolyspora endophytica TaxID=543886 RepID=UPI001FEC8999|nr:hypothetical protein [Saccharopolyspora endophytica]
MSYQPHDPYDRNDPGRYPYGDDYGDRRPPRRPGQVGDTIARVVRIVVSIVVLVFALHVLFVVLDANQSNGFVSFIYTLAQTFVLGLGDVFTPEDALLGVVLNYALAALIWFIVGQIIIKIIRR